MNSEKKCKTSVGIVKPQRFTFAQPPDELLLECGKNFGPVTVEYETYGELSPEKDNAILILHALSGDAHVAGFHDEKDQKPGWWDIMVGPGKAFDTDTYFIVCSNVIGGCKGTTGPGSLNPKTKKPFGLDFPIITIEDMVNVQKRLVDHLGITRLLAVAGGSMGGMQALQWAVSYPDMVASSIVIASTARLSPQSIAFNEVGRNAIIFDPDWKGGNYYAGGQPSRGLAIARMIGHITYLSDESMREKFGRRLKDKETYSYDFLTEFQVESYLHYQGARFVERFDANSYLYITKAMDYFDLSVKYGSLNEAFKGVKSRFLIVSFTSDWLFPAYQSKEIVKSLMNMNKDVTYCCIESNYGHDAFLVENESLSTITANFLNKTYKG